MEASVNTLKLAMQAVVLCQVEKAKEDMLTQLYSSIRFDALCFAATDFCITRSLLHGFLLASFMVVSLLALGFM